ncbi:response regulator [Fischerella sp. PCC 9605]|uniref:response regulator n=1 Tax=Fischerella sp. PCC 9605 TaxID=1173024 RepID=UPI00047C1C92|nr:response regulator [Fischerella sp. PCC 9605]
MRILLVEDDESFARLVRKTLTTQHYLVDLTTDGQAGCELAEAFAYDLILLDVMLPNLDGISFCKRLRQVSASTTHLHHIPILLMTAQDTIAKKVTGLDAGADDYMVKPFDLQELLARVRALLRRSSSTLLPAIEWGSLRLDPSNCQVSYDGQLLHLTAKEYALLELFLRNSHRIFSQSALLDQLWSFEDLPSDNTVRAHIKSLRQKLKKAGAETDLIETVYGLGYRLKSRESSIARQERKSKIHRRPQDISPKGCPKSKIQNPQTQQQTTEKISTIWERHKEKYINRITVLEQAVTYLLKTTLSEELRQKALRQAHTLIGSLGSFGFDEASRLSRQIEQILKIEEKLPQVQIEQLSQMVVALRQELEQTPAILESPAPQSITIKQQARLLVVDDDTALAEQLISEATTRGMLVELATDLSQAREAIAHTQPDVVLLDLCFPDSAENGFTLLAELTAKQPTVPVLVFTAAESFADRVKVARLGGRGFLQKPISPERVMDAIASVLQQSSQPSAQLMIVDDDPQVLDFLRSLLEPWGFQLTLLEDPQQFWSTLEQSAPDLLILDVEMPELSGIDLCQVVRNDSRWHDLPILFLSAHTDIETVQRVFTSGADDYVTKPIIGAELIARVLNRLERTKILRNLAEIDELTGLTNRRRSIQQLTQLLRLAERQNQPLCFAVLDLDNFKQVNDQYGHDAGDKVLRRLGELLKQSFRSEDVVARWGGEEFVVGLYDTTRNSGVKRLTEVLEILHQQKFSDRDRSQFCVSFSAGVAEFPQDGADLQALYRVADALLYQAKAAGRNQVLG